MPEKIGFLVLNKVALNVFAPFLVVFEMSLGLLSMTLC